MKGRSLTSWTDKERKEHKNTERNESDHPSLLINQVKVQARTQPPTFKCEHCGEQVKRGHACCPQDQ